MIALFLVDVRQRLSVEYVAIVVRLAADEVIQLLSLEHDGSSCRVGLAGSHDGVKRRERRAIDIRRFAGSVSATRGTAQMGGDGCGRYPYD